MLNKLSVSKITVIYKYVITYIHIYTCTALQMLQSDIIIDCHRATYALRTLRRSDIHVVSWSDKCKVTYKIIYSLLEQ